MAHSHADALRWCEQGTVLFRKAAAGLTDAYLRAPSSLPRWTNGHIVSHVAANAVALGNLVVWAATGIETPMYASTEEREAGIARGGTITATEAEDLLNTTAQDLAGGMAALTPEQWSTEVRTAQGRLLPAAEIPWLRSREVMVHAVDIDGEITFNDVEARFLTALCDDVVAKRNTTAGPAVGLFATDTGARWQLEGDGPSATLVGTLAEVAAYLTGRPHRLGAMSGTMAPALPPWL